MAEERTPLLQEQGHEQDDNSLARTLSASHWLAPDSSAQRDVVNVPQKHTPALYLINISTTRFWIMYIPILFVYFVATFDSTLMASSHPVITSYFHSSNSASWLSTAFMLTSTTFQPLYGRVSDLAGRKPCWIFSLVVFGTTTVWCARAQSMTSFIIARAFCGLGAGGVMGMASIMTNDFISIERRSVYQAYINIFYGLGSSCGAAFGGFLCDTIGWRWTFGIQVPPIILILTFGLLTVPSDLGPNLAKASNQNWLRIVRDFDISGSIFLTLAIGCLILGLNLGGNVLPWEHPLIIASLVLSGIAAAVLVQVERRAKRPIMPMAVLSTSPHANLLFANFFSQIGTLTIIFNAPLYFQAVKLDTPSASGFRLAAPSLLLTACAVSTGFYVNATGWLKGPQVLGAICMFTGGICLASLWDGIPTWLATIFVIPPSVGQGFMFPVTSVSLLAITLKADQAVVTSAISVWRNLGTVMGVAFSSLILQNTLIKYLDQYVTGADKAEVIQRVRKEVRAITELKGVQQQEVIKAYGDALRWVFVSAILSFIVVNLLIWPVKLPRLGRDKVAADVEGDEDDQPS